MTKNIILAAMAVIILLGGFFFFSTKEKMAAETQVAAQTTAQTGSGVATTPCPDTASMRQELIAAEKAATAAAAEAQAKALALKAAQKNCRPPLSGGDTLNVRLITDQPRASAARTQPRSKRSSTATPNSNSPQDRRPANTPIDYNYVETGTTHGNDNRVTGGDVAQTTLCFQLREGDGGSHWPHIAINANQQITGAVLNSERNGYNVIVYPSTTISGLWGITSTKTAFIQAELIKDFNPTTLLIAGDYSNWQWIRAELIGDYYVAQF